MERSVGRSHALVRRLRTLRRERRAREEEGVVLAEGLHLAREALRSGLAIELAVLDERLEGSDEGLRLLDALRDAGISLFRVARTVLEGISEARAPQPLLTLVRRPDPARRTDLGTGLWALADGLQDPGNLGNLIRTADAAGCAGVVVCGGADPFHPRSVRAAMGSSLTLPLLGTTPAQIVDASSCGEIALFGCDAHEGEAYDRIEIGENGVVAFGAEGRGLSDELAAACRRRVRIPLDHGVDSLSVGAAAAVVLFDLARRRRS